MAYGRGFNSRLLHHYNLQRHSLCMSMNPVRPRVWRGFSLLLACLSTSRTPLFPTLTPVFPLPFSPPCVRAIGQGRKDESFKINNLRMTTTPDLFSIIGRHPQNSE